jgi:hypothetical protein
MDSNIMSSIGFGGGTFTILLLAWNVLKYFNHRHIRSTCCGSSAEVGIDIGTPSSVDATKKIDIPSRNESV